MSFPGGFPFLSRSSALRRRISELIDAGVGLYSNFWEIDGTTLDADTLSTQILEWCRGCLVRMRRPHGLSFISMALAISGENSEPVDSVPFSGILPGDFYGDGEVEQRIRKTIAGWKDSGVLGQGSDLRIRAVMFSWGDLTYGLLRTESSN